METTGTQLSNEQTNELTINLNQEAQYYLQQAGKWATFLGIVGFIICGLFFVMALFIGSVFAFLAKFSPASSSTTALAAMGPMLSVIYIIIDVIYFMLVLYLYQFGYRIKKGIAFIDNATVTSALGKLKSFFKTWGIVTIVFLSIYGLIFIGVVIAGISAAKMMH